MEYIMPDSHLELLQAILVELVKARDPDAVFVARKVVENDSES